jgi:CheY-like chemotaxis protein
MRADVLLVDDDADSREFVSRFLERAGHSVRCAKDGHEALNALGWAVPDLIILDYRMPDMDGVSVLGVLRSYLRWGHVPVVFLTAYPDEPRVQEAKELGVEHVFVKSQFRLEELLDFIVDRVKQGQAVAPQSQPNIAPQMEQPPPIR